MLPPQYEETGSEYQIQLPGYNDNLGGYTEKLEPKAMRSSIVRVELDKPEEKEIETWYTQGSVISGRIAVTPFKNIEFSKITIKLVVREVVYKRSNGLAVGHKYTKTSTLGSYTIHESLYPENNQLDQDTAYFYNFSLQFPYMLPDRPRIALQQLLPPTLGAQTEGEDIKKGWDIADGSVRINYRLEAQIHDIDPTCDHPIAASGIRYVKFAPSQTAALHQEYLQNQAPSEHIQVTKCLKSGLIKKSEYGAITVKAANNQSVSITRCNKLTKVDVGFTFTPSSLDQPPPQIKRITVKLTAHTVSNKTILHYVPTIGNPGPMVDVLKEHTRVLQLDGPYLCWSAVSDSARATPPASPVLGAEEYPCDAKENEPVTISDEDNDKQVIQSTPLLMNQTSENVTYLFHETYSSTLTIPIVLPDIRNLLPTYYGGLTSRQYELLFHVEFCKFQSVDLRVPVILERRYGHDTSPSYSESNCPSLSSIYSRQSSYSNTISI